jgi:hypothetical protein
LKFREAASLERYFHNQLKQNPSYYYAFQLDIEELIINIFWADARIVIDNSHFGDVVTFDTIYSTKNRLVYFWDLTIIERLLYLELHCFMMKQLSLLYDCLRLS